MALDKTALIAALTAIFENADPDATAEEAAEAIADAIDDYVKTGTAGGDPVT